MSKVNKLLLISIFILLIGISIKLLSGNFIASILTLNKPVNDANLLIVEGWLYDEELKEASEIFESGTYNYIVASGILMPPFYMMGMNGDLVFNVKKKKIPPGKHELFVEAYSTLANEESGRFSVLINDKEIDEVNTTSLPNFYSFIFESNTDIDSVTIRFLNDALFEEQDINFYLASITIDGFRFTVNDTLNYYSISHIPDIKHTLAKSHDIRVKYVLERYHVPENKILTIRTLVNSESRTAQTAKNTLHVLDSIFKKDTLKINILSREFHSRRTYLAYKKYSGKKNQIGIITSHFKSPEVEKGRLKNLKELLGIIYIMIIP